MTRTRKLVAVLAAAGAALAIAVAAAAATYTNNTPVAIPDGSITIPPTAGEATSTISVTETATVTSVQVTLLGVEHENAEDLDIAVLSPAGTRVVLMSDAGKTPAEERPVGPTRYKPLTSIAPGTNLVFSDAAGSAIPEFGAIPSGTYRPADYGASSDPFCSGESDQTMPYTTTLSSFNGQQANGTWTLVARDDCGGFTGQLAAGWCIVINTSSGPCQMPTAVTVSSLSTRRVAGGMQVAWRTASEAGVAGFNVYRAAWGTSVRVNRSLIAAKHAGTARGASYRFVDRAARRSGAYRLQVVHLNGSRSWAR